MSRKKPAKRPAKKSSVSKPKSEILSASDNRTAESVSIRALIQNFSDGTADTLEAIEKHDPGFIKRYVRQIETFAKKSHEERESFAKFQAYGNWFLKIIAAIFIFYMVWYVITLELGAWANFSTLIALVIFYSITQGGSAVWRRIAEALANRINPKHMPPDGD